MLTRLEHQWLSFVIVSERHKQALFPLHTILSGICFYNGSNYISKWGDSSNQLLGPSYE